MLYLWHNPARTAELETLASGQRLRYHERMDLRTYFSTYGRRAELARLLDPPVTHAAIRQWNPDHIPAERVLQVERLTGISRHVLRPDLYPIGYRGPRRRK